MAAARVRLEARAKARAAAERADYEAKVVAREQRQGRARGNHPKPPDESPHDNEQSNLSDPDSRLMRKSKHHEYRQAYNPQAVVDAEGSQLILGARVSNCASDRNELVADIEAIPAIAGKTAESRLLNTNPNLSKLIQPASHHFRARLFCTNRSTSSRTDC